MSNSSPFNSILFDESAPEDIDRRPMPDFFSDLNLDQITASLTVGREEYKLKPFFYTALSRREIISYRHDIFRDLEDVTLFSSILSFSQGMQDMRRHLAQADKLHYKRQQQSWFLDAVDIYCSAVERLADDLTLISLRSRGFVAFREFLTQYAKSAEFVSLFNETRKMKTDLAGIRYRLQIEGKRIRVDRYESEPDYGAGVLETFDKFKRETARAYRFGFSSDVEINHVEAAILDLVAKRYPDIFISLEEYNIRHRDFLPNTFRVFEREVQFYIAFIDYMRRFQEKSFYFCYPTVTRESKEVYGREIFDLALADRLLRENINVVTNNFYLQDPERVIVVTGPNQGGKTTFARTFGQLHYLASIGCLVPGREARLFLYDQLFTHFEREENIHDLAGKLEADLIRIHRILEQASSNSILVMNESFLSTTLSDALFLSKQVMLQIMERDMLCVSVTFLDELASLSKTTVSMVSTIDPKNPALRTFKIIRKPADGLAYAMAIAEKYRLTHQRIKERLGS